MYPGQRPTSVTVLAIIGIIFAALGTFGAIFMVAMLMGVTAQDPFNKALMEDGAYRGMQIVSEIVHTVLTVVLWIGSIGSLKLQPGARTAMLVYAWASIISGVISSIAMFIILPDLLDKAMAAASMTMPPEVAQMTRSMLVVMMPISVILGAAYPVCVLIFYTRKKVVNAFQGKFEGPPPAPYYNQQYYPPQGPAGY
jgi:hypothetical protein